MEKKTVYDIVTEKVMEVMKDGKLPWRKPWIGGAMRPMNAVTGRHYNGGNLFLLSMLPYAQPAYMTFNQIKAAGATIKKGEEKKYVPVFYWNFIDKKDATTGKKTGDKFPMLRYFLVWNVEQVEGYELPEKFKPNTADFKHDANFAAEAIVQGYTNKPEIVVKETNKACYYPVLDQVQVPKMEQFPDLGEFYSTLFHELGHSTGHSSRLNRKEVMDQNYFGSHDYSQEELTAELTSAFLCMEAGIDNTLDTSAAYLSHWMGKLKNDPKLFWTAAGKAQKAADYILGKKKEEAEETA